VTPPSNHPDPTSPERVLALWREQPSWSATQEDVQRSLKARGGAKNHVRAALHTLVNRGELEKHGPRYRLPQGGRHAPVPGAKSSSAPRMVGTYMAHPDGYGFVWIADTRDSMFIPPRDTLGALDGDWVGVEVTPSQRTRTSGRITAVLERRRVRARGTVERDKGHTWIVPLNLRIPDILIEPQPGDPDYPTGTLVDVAITAFPRDADEAPAGRIVALAPTEDTPAALVDSIVANSTLHLGFSPAAQAQAEALAGTDVLAQARREERTDLTRVPFITIDPEDARDFDDAVYLEPGPVGREKLWVAIADVAAYVPPGSPLDEDAFAKGTSVYFPASVLPMLPEVLSNDLCSLRPLEPRLAMVVEMELDPEGHPHEVRFHEAVIRSSERLNYGQVQALFDGTPGAEGISAPAAEMLLRMKRMAEALRHKRNLRGALNFTFPEVRFELDDKGMPVRILRKYPTDATRLVEQFMLEANECVAAHCTMHEMPALFRVHDPPPEDQLPQVVARLWNHRIHANVTLLRTPKGFCKVLAEVHEHPDRESLELVLLKSTAQAQYRERNEGHFALAAEHYCHFTSPIRRYPDVVVHRALKAWIHRDRVRMPEVPRPDVGMHLSARERLAADVEQQVARLYRVLYLEPNLGEEFAATVTGVTEKGLTIGLRDEFIDSMLPVFALTDAEYRFDRERQVLVGRNRRTVAFGQRLVVQLVKADRYAQRLEFAFRRWGWETPTGKSGGANASGGKQTGALKSPSGKPAGAASKAKAAGKQGRR
jgi:ribonuclease R